MTSKHRFANKLFATAFVAAAFSAAAISPLYADDSWKGPGWYQVFDDSGDPGDGIGEVVMIWTGPYPDEAACMNYVKQKFADPAYVRSMIAKYGDPKDWSFSCDHLDQNLPD